MEKHTYCSLRKAKKIKVTIKKVWWLASPKTTQESHRKLKKSVLFMVIDYYSERIQTKMSKEKAFVRQSPGGTRHQLLVDLSEWSYADRAYFSLPVILHICGLLLGGGGGGEGFFTSAWLTAYMSELQTPTSPEVRLIKFSPKAPTINQVLSLVNILNTVNIAKALR